jgi:hypothetical protein
VVGATQGVAHQLEREHREVGRERMKAARAVLAVAAEGRAVVPVLVPVVVVVLVAGVPRFMTRLVRILRGLPVLVGEGPMGSIPRRTALVPQLEAPVARDESSTSTRLAERRSIVLVKPSRPRFRTRPQR